MALLEASDWTIDELEIYFLDRFLQYYCYEYLLNAIFDAQISSRQKFEGQS